MSFLKYFCPVKLVSLIIGGRDSGTIGLVTGTTIALVSYTGTWYRHLSGKGDTRIPIAGTAFGVLMILVSLENIRARQEAMLNDGIRVRRERRKNLKEAADKLQAASFIYLSRNLKVDAAFEYLEQTYGSFWNSHLKDAGGDQQPRDYSAELAHGLAIGLMAVTEYKAISNKAGNYEGLSDHIVTASRIGMVESELRSKVKKAIEEFDEESRKSSEERSRKRWSTLMRKLLEELKNYNVRHEQKMRRYNDLFVRNESASSVVKTEDSAAADEQGSYYAEADELILTCGTCDDDSDGSITAEEMQIAKTIVLRATEKITVPTESLVYKGNEVLSPKKAEADTI